MNEETREKGESEFHVDKMKEVRLRYSNICRGDKWEGVRGWSWWEREGGGAMKLAWKKWLGKTGCNFNLSRTWHNW